MASAVDGVAYAAIGTADIELSLALYRDAMGGSVVGDEEIGGAGVERLYGLPAGARVRRVTVSFYEGCYGRVQLLDFGAAALGEVLEGERPHDFGCSKTVDFFVDDYPEVERRLAQAGMSWVAAPRTYSDGPFTSTEGILRAPDGARLAILRIHGAPREIVAQGTGLFSEVGASLHNVAELEPMVRFLRDGFGWAVHFAADLNLPDIDALVGLPAGTGLHLTIMAPEGLNTGKLGVIRVNGEPGSDLSAQARPPHRGIVAHGLQAVDLDGLLPRLAALGGTVEVEPLELDLGPWGPAHIAAVTAPSGVRVELFEPL